MLGGNDCSSAKQAMPVEPLNNMAAEIISVLADAKNISVVIGDRLFSPANMDNTKAQEPFTLEQKLQLAHAMSIELRATLGRIAERV